MVLLPEGNLPLRLIEAEKKTGVSYTEKKESYREDVGSHRHWGCVD